MSAHELAYAEAFLRRVRNDIPLSAALQLRVTAWNGQTLSLQLPLDPNINDKGTAFAGSITAAGSLCGWVALSLWAEAQGLACQIAIFDAHFSFRRPIQADFQVCTSLPDAEVMSALKASLEASGKARLPLRISMGVAASEAAWVDAAYALWRV